MKLRNFIFFLSLMFLTNNAFAEAQTRSQGQGWTLGLGAAYKTSPYRGVENKTTPFPLLSYQGERVFLRGPQAGYILIKEKGFAVTVLGNYRLQGYESSDSRFLKGMEDRHGTLESGLQASFKNSFGQIRLTWLSDLLNEHSGHEAKMTLSKSFRFKKLMIVPSVDATWQSEQLADYYYGVEQKEARFDRPAYQVDSTLVYSAGLMVNFMMNERWSITSRVSLVKLSDEISDSPIVNEDIATKGFLGVGYRF